MLQVYNSRLLYPRPANIFSRRATTRHNIDWLKKLNSNPDFESLPWPIVALRTFSIFAILRNNCYTAGHWKKLRILVTWFDRPVSHPLKLPFRYREIALLPYLLHSLYFASNIPKKIESWNFCSDWWNIVDWSMVTSNRRSNLAARMDDWKISPKFTLKK